MIAWKPKKKWWEVATTQDERDLFVILSRDPRYDWRKVSTLLEDLGWGHGRLEAVVMPYIKRRMIYVHKGRNAIFLGYWERVENKVKRGRVDPAEFDTDADTLDLNVI